MLGGKSRTYPKVCKVFTDNAVAQKYKRKCSSYFLTVPKHRFLTLLKGSRQIQQHISKLYKFLKSIVRNFTQDKKLLLIVVVMLNQCAAIFDGCVLAVSYT